MLPEVKPNQSQSPPRDYLIPHQRPVINQGSCHACWAFGAKHILQDALFNTAEVSAQHLVDCSRRDGCRGGWPAQALQLVENHGFYLDSEYPYKERTGTCYNKNGYQEVFYNGDGTKMRARITYNPDARYLKQLIYQKGSIAINMYLGVLRSLGSGVVQTINNSYCRRQGDHIITLIGWKGNDYWIVRNSWGPYWGENGFGKM